MAAETTPRVDEPLDIRIAPTGSSAAVVSSPTEGPNRAEELVLSIRNLNVHYGAFHAVADVGFDVPKNRVTALIGPSGCGKSTVLRCINRMNDLVPTARVDGQILYHGLDICSPRVDPVEVRRRIGMV